MPFSPIKANTRNRFSEVMIHLDFIDNQEPKDITQPTPIQIKILRGMYYVHLYAVLEKTVNEVVEHALLLIRNDNVLNRHYRMELNVISLNPKMQGFKAAGYKNFFEKSLEVFLSIDKDQPAEIDNTLFSLNLQNIWYHVLDQVLKCMGLHGFSIEPRLVHVINELVEKRNAIAHGRESPITLGERYRCDVLRQRTSDVQNISGLFIDAVESHILSKEYIKPHYRANYAGA